MTFVKKFDSLKTKLIKADTKKFTESFAAQVNMTDEDCGGAFYIAFINGNYSVEPYDYVDNTVMLTGKAAAIAKLASGTLDKSIEINGNADHARMIASAFKKPVAKKTAAKKTETKTAAKKAADKAPAPAKSAAVETKSAAKTVAATTATKETAVSATAVKATEVKASAASAKNTAKK